MRLRFFALFMISVLLFAGTLPAMAAGVPSTQGETDDEYIVGLIGPIEALRPFNVGVTSMKIYPSWRGYYFPGMIVSQGSMEITNVSPTAFGLALWVDSSPRQSWPGIEFQVKNIRVAPHDGLAGKLGSWKELSSPNDLVIGSGESWTVQYEIMVSPYSWGGKVDRTIVRINHLELCPTPSGKIEICGMG